MIRLFVKKRERQSFQFQFYMHQFVESAVKAGIRWKSDRVATNKLIRLFIKVLMLFRISKLVKKDNAIIITSSGGDLKYNAFPYYNYEIIPMLWDVWPCAWHVLFRDLKGLDCKIVFVTVRSMAEKISKELGIKAFWIPEGIDISDYSKGENLASREIDVYELGRQMRNYHQILENTLGKGQLVCNKYDSNGALLQLAYPTAQDLLEHLNKTKIIISFPQADTHPERAGGLETLTQRYWEAMLSGCLILGRAPQELIDFIGYNPVIDIDWSAPENQILSILSNIAQYQKWVDKNYETARNLASWDLRIQQIKTILSQNGYSM